MIRWELIDSSQVPGSGREIRLYKRGAEFSIRLEQGELMNSRMHGSEEALAELACAKISGCACPRVLIGGLGMGYTLAAALRLLGPGAGVIVAELVPSVVEWNRGVIAHLAGHPLEDNRVTVCEDDVVSMIMNERGAYDAVLLDVDNGPEGLTRQSNDRLYTGTGLDAAFAALRPGGVLTVWSSDPNHAFTRRLRQAGFRVSEVHAHARGTRRGGKHMIWVAVR